MPPCKINFPKAVLLARTLSCCTGFQTPVISAKKLMVFIVGIRERSLDRTNLGVPMITPDQKSFGQDTATLRCRTTFERRVI